MEYPAWECTHAGEDFDRAQSLAAQLTEQDRREGKPAPAHGYSAERFEEARRIVDGANIWRK